MSDRQLFRYVALQFAMGAALGLVFAIVLLTLNLQQVRDLVLNNPAPATNLVILTLGCCAYFAFGAAITGFHFLVASDH